MKAAALFSGGKDSVLSIHEAIRGGVNVNYLLLLKPTLPVPNPHWVNRHLVEMVAEALGVELVVVELVRGREEESLASALRGLGVDYLVGGDVFVEDHVRWYEEVCSQAGVDLIEPLYGVETEELYHRALDLGVRFHIIAVNREVNSDLVGLSIGREDRWWFLDELKSRGIDPIGENGEYHTLVEWAPEFKVSRLKFRADGIVDDGYGGVVGVFRLQP